MLTVVEKGVTESKYYAALAGQKLTEPSSLESCHVLRIKAAPFGHNAPLKPIRNAQGIIIDQEEWPLAERGLKLTLTIAATDKTTHISELFEQIFGPDPLQLQRLSFAISVSDDEGEASAPLSLDQMKVTGSTDAPTFSATLPELRRVQSTIQVTTQIVSAGQWRVGEITVGLVCGNKAAKFVVASASESRGFQLKIDDDQGRTVSAGSALWHRVGGGEVAAFLNKDLRITRFAPQLASERQRFTIALDAMYDQIKPDSWAIIVRGDKSWVRKIEQVHTISKAAYGMSGRVTQLVLEGDVQKEDWLDASDTTLLTLRNTTIYAQSEPLTIVDEPITSDVADKYIVLDGLYDGLEEGRWVIVSGERTDLGVVDSELAMIASVREGFGTDDSGAEVTSSTTLTSVRGEVEESSSAPPGDTLHTKIFFVVPLANSYKRDTVTIYGNVVKATHGETRKEVLGSGDGRQGHQRFTLKQKPLTYLAAASATGAASTLEVRVNDVLWHKAEDLTDAGPNDRVYVTQADDEENTTVVFGDGLAGARLPSGVENIRATYRNGIGRPGNVAAQQISLLATRPLGVKGVINPLDATGGADRDTRDQARRNAPLGVTALDRLVSVRDYADFALTYAGIGKASAMRLSDGRRQAVHLTIAGLDDIPIAKSSDLYRGLTQALHRLGDPQQQVIIETRDQVLLVIKARVRLLSDYEWETTEPRIRSAMLTAFGFDGRDLGQPVYCSEIIRVIESVPGVAFVDVDLLAGVSGADIATAADLEAKLKELAQSTTGANPVPPEQPIAANLARRDSTGEIHAAQLAFLSPALPQTLMLEVIE